MIEWRVSRAGSASDDIVYSATAARKLMLAQIAAMGGTDEDIPSLSFPASESARRKGWIIYKSRVGDALAVTVEALRKERFPGG